MKQIIFGPRETPGSSFPRAYRERIGSVIMKALTTAANEKSTHPIPYQDKVILNKYFKYYSKPNAYSRVQFNRDPSYYYRCLIKLGYQMDNRYFFGEIENCRHLTENKALKKFLRQVNKIAAKSHKDKYENWIRTVTDYSLIRRDFENKGVIPHDTEYKFGVPTQWKNSPHYAFKDNMIIEKGAVDLQTCNRDEILLFLDKAASTPYWLGIEQFQYMMKASYIYDEKIQNYAAIACRSQLFSLLSPIESRCDAMANISTELESMSEYFPRLWDNKIRLMTDFSISAEAISSRSMNGDKLNELMTNIFNNSVSGNWAFSSDIRKDCFQIGVNIDSAGPNVHISFDLINKFTQINEILSLYSATTNLPSSFSFGFFEILFHEYMHTQGQAYRMAKNPAYGNDRAWDIKTEIATNKQVIDALYHPDVYTKMIANGIFTISLLYDPIGLTTPFQSYGDLAIKILDTYYPKKLPKYIKLNIAKKVSSLFDEFAQVFAKYVSSPFTPLYDNCADKQTTMNKFAILDEKEKSVQRYSIIDPFNILNKPTVQPLNHPYRTSQNIDAHAIRP